MERIEETGFNQQALLQEGYLRQLDELNVGQIVGGVVVQVGSEFVFVDIGYKSEGRIPIGEFDDPPSAGDQVKVILLNKEAVGGGIEVSKRQADEKIKWDTLRASFEDKIPIEGTVFECTNKGYRVRLFRGISGFVPLAHMELFRDDKLDSYMNFKATFHVERLYYEDRLSIILSRRSVLRQKIEEDRRRFFRTTKIGDVVEGVAKSFVSFGVFVDLGGFDGLLHNKDIGWGRTVRVRDYINKGDHIKVKVTKLDLDRSKIGLSLRDLTDNPWENFSHRYQVNDIVEGVVRKLLVYGAFVEIEPGIDGMVHVSEMSWIKRINNPHEMLRVGDVVQVMILGYNIQEKQVALGMKQAMKNPWDDVEYRYHLGSRVTGTIRKLLSSGAIVELEKGVEGFVYVDEFTWDRNDENPMRHLKRGDEIEVMILMIDRQRNRIRLSVKRLGDSESENPWDDLVRSYSKQEAIIGKITNITDFGVFVLLADSIEGLVDKNNLCDPRSESFETASARLHVGDTLKVMITDIRPEKQRVALSVRRLDQMEQMHAMNHYMHDEGDATTHKLGDLIKKEG